jgi:hypothetical protein
MQITGAVGLIYVNKKHRQEIFTLNPLYYLRSCHLLVSVYIIKTPQF